MRDRWRRRPASSQLTVVAVAGPVTHDLSLALVEGPVAAEREVVRSSRPRKGRHNAAMTVGGAEEKGSRGVDSRGAASPVWTRRHHGRRSRRFSALISPPDEHRAPLRPARPIEPKWQEVWERERTWEVSNDDAGGDASSTSLEMLPYPSGEPHMGHLKNYSVGDAVAHFHRRIGRRVLHPMGYDAFGLPAENHAIKTGEHPRDVDREVDRRLPAQFRSLGHLDRLVARVRHARAALLPLDAVDLPEAVRARPGLPRRRGGQLVPERPDRARQRAGHRRPLRALRHAGRGAPARAVVLPHHRLRRPPARRPRDDRVARARQDDAAQLDRALRGRRGRVQRDELGIDYPVFTTRPDTLFGATFFVMAPEHPDVLRLAEGTEHEQAVREYVNHALTESHEERGDAEREKTGVPLGRTVDQPGQRRADPDVRRRLRADGVRHRRDHGRARARRARLRVRARSTACRSGA